ncbi:MAG: glycosyltransferase [Ignavibacteriaceae bacterium]|nr:glycosyltransferase [Ignavibacteriaceae bacterium]
MNVKKIAYFVGEFPSKSETWIWNEITALLQKGFIINVFSRDKKIPWNGNDPNSIVTKTTYRSKYFLLKILKSPLKNIVNSIKIIAAIWKDVLSDTNGLRGKLQILRDLSFFLSINEKIKEYNPDLIIVHFANATANPVLFNHIVNKTPYIIKMHAIDVYRRTNLFRLKAANAKKILTISEFNIDFIKNRDSDIDISKFIIHRCGIPLNGYEFKPRYENPNKIPIILSVGRLARVKGFDVLLKASAQLAKKKIAHRITIIGYGPEKQALSKLANVLGINEHVEMMDYCPPEKVKEILNSSNLFVLASKYDEEEIQEGVPVSIMEAMSVGLPVISTKIGGIPELVEDKKTGYLIEPNNPIELAEKIEELLKMPKSELQTIVQNARKKIEIEYNLDKLNEELLTLFDTIT